MKKKAIFISFIIIIIVVIIGFILINKNDSSNSSENNIELRTSMWITPLTTYTINGTNDTFKITHEVNFPDFSSGEFTSWIQNIKYTITVNNVEYQGSFTFDSDSDDIRKDEDGNQNYNIKIYDYKDNSVFLEITKNDYNF